MNFQLDRESCDKINVSIKVGWQKEDQRLIEHAGV